MSITVPVGEPAVRTSTLCASLACWRRVARGAARMVRMAGSAAPPLPRVHLISAPCLRDHDVPEWSST
jgi:hypothetical protein